jgi:REP element-mobilizing transposase RayT
MLYRNKYRVESTRLENWDYSSPGWYFVTICTHNRLPFLSDIIDKKVVLKSAGIIADREWQKTGIIRNNIEIDEYVIMPNHIHGIVRIKQNEETPCHGVSTTNDNTPTEPIKTTDEPKKRSPKNWKSGVLGAIIGQFKIVVTKQTHQNGVPEYNWQSRFHDHIVRNERELYFIRKYIRENPENWESGRNNWQPEKEMEYVAASIEQSTSIPY